VNGKIVGGMTPIELSLELDLAGQSLILVVSRYRIEVSGSPFARNDQSMLPNIKAGATWWQDDSDYNASQRLDWNEINAIGNDYPVCTNPQQILHLEQMQMKQNANSQHSATMGYAQYNDSGGKVKKEQVNRNKHDCFNRSPEKQIRSKSNHHEREIQTHNLSKQGANRGPRNTKTGSKKKVKSKLLQKKKVKHKMKERWSSISESDDDNPWLGCICGIEHPEPIVVFWIQCDACSAWYNVAEKCVGFNEEAAARLDKWDCFVCCMDKKGVTIADTSPCKDVIYEKDSRDKGSSNYSRENDATVVSVNENSSGDCGILSRYDATSPMSKPSSKTIFPVGTVVR